MNATALALIVAALLPVSEPSFGQEAGAGPVLREFAVGLAAEGIPSGFVVPEASLRFRPGGPAKVLTRPAGLQTAARAAAVAEQFNKNGGLLRATVEAGVVHIRADGMPSSLVEALARTTEVKEVDGLPANRALISVVMPSMRGGGEPGGLVGVGQVSTLCPFDAPIRLKGRTATATAVLDEIVLQVPGLAWTITYDLSAPTNNVKVGFVCFDASYSRFTMD